MVINHLLTGMILQADPWSVPQNPQPTVYVSEFLNHLGVKGDVRGMLQGYVGFPLELLIGYTPPASNSHHQDFIFWVGDSYRLATFTGWGGEPEL